MMDQTKLIKSSGALGPVPMMLCCVIVRHTALIAVNLKTRLALHAAKRAHHELARMILNVYS